MFRLSVRVSAILIFAGSLPASDLDAGQKVAHRNPAIAGVFPQGCGRGRTLRVDIIGEHLDRASSLSFDRPGIQGRIVQSSFTRLALDFQVSPEAAYGQYAFRVITPRGVSSPGLFRIGDLPHVEEREPNTSLATANEVALPVTINARLERDGDFDFYRFQVKAGDTWIFDLRSARNGNSLDAALFLLDENGTRIAYDEDHYIWDPFLVHRFETGGTYVAAVQPTHRNNDPAFAYQLDIRKSAQLKVLSPIALRAGKENEVTLYGAALLDPDARLEFDHPGFRGSIQSARGGSAAARIYVPEGAAAGEYRLHLDGASGRSNGVSFLVEALPAQPNETLPVPTAITGTAHYRQPERFPFEAVAGEVLTFEVRAHRYGSPVDSVLRLLDKDGKVLASNDDFKTNLVQFNKDSRLEYKFEQTGRYNIEVRNLTATEGEGYPYEFIVSRANPHVELELQTDRIVVYPGETAPLKVTAVPLDGFKGEVPLKIEGLPPLVTAKTGGKDVLQLSAATEAPPGAYAIATVTSPPAPLPASKLVKISSGGGEGAAALSTGNVFVAVAEKPLFSLEAQATAVTLVRGGTAELPLDIAYADGFDGEIQFQPADLPAGVHMEPATIRQKEKRVVLRLRADVEAEPGRYPRLTILGSSSKDGRTEAAPKIALSVQ